MATAGRFDYVKYDDKAISDQAAAKQWFQEIESFIETLQSPRAKEYAHTKAEEAYMWIGKAIRDDQVARNGSTELQESRTNI